MLVSSMVRGLTLGLLAANICSASPAPDRVIEARVPNPVAQLGQPSTTIKPGGPPCGTNSPTNRGCWKSLWNIFTDYEADSPGPPPGTTREIDLYVTNTTSFGPDGVNKPAMLVNGTFPGPTIYANWGDWLQINVHNQMADNGTSIHWHGLRQRSSCNQDGTNGITECPIAPGRTRSYTFRLSQYGTSWYHSHFSNQYGNGVVGAIQINGPASADYDIDLGPYVISDWYHSTTDVLSFVAEKVAPAPASDNILFNGTNINPNGKGGAYNKVKLTPGKKHLLRIINTSVENHFTVSLVGHTFTVVGVDFVSVEPVKRSSLMLAVGQRYDVVIEATQAVGNYWFNATLSPDSLCGESRNPYPAAIFQYQGASNSNPTDKGVAVAGSCLDSTGFVPIIGRTIPESKFRSDMEFLNVTLTQETIDRGQVFRWQVNGNAIDVRWDKPTLQYVMEGNTSYPDTTNLVKVDSVDEWTFWVIENTPPDGNGVPHPIHLHGHDFLVLGSGTGAVFDPARDVGRLNMVNPVRRDVAMLPTGWLVIAFRTDNPGAWLLHCHIAWHVSQGLSVQFLERVGEIDGDMHLEQMVENCEAWRAYKTVAYYDKVDSGL